MDDYQRSEGDAEARRMVAEWRKNGWPGPLEHDNERMLEWATVAEAISPEQADAVVRFEADEGNEMIVTWRQMLALGHVRKQAMDAARERAQEAKRGR